MLLFIFSYCNKIILNLNLILDELGSHTPITEQSPSPQRTHKQDCVNTIYKFWIHITKITIKSTEGALLSGVTVNLDFRRCMFIISCFKLYRGQSHWVSGYLHENNETRGSHQERWLVSSACFFFCGCERMSLTVKTTWKVLKNQ